MPAPFLNGITVRRRKLPIRKALAAEGAVVCAKALRAAPQRHRVGTRGQLPSGQRSRNLLNFVSVVTAMPCDGSMIRSDGVDAH
jgi:hypothetical protein